MTNIKLYNEIMNNEDAFFHELVELSNNGIFLYLPIEI